MLNLESRANVHLTPDRYRQLLKLIERLRSWDKKDRFFVRELHALFEMRDSGEKTRHAMMNCLRKCGVISLRPGKPLNYCVRLDRIDDVMRHIQATLDLFDIERNSRLLAAS